MTVGRAGGIETAPGGRKKSALERRDADLVHPDQPHRPARGPGRGRGGWRARLHGAGATGGAIGGGATGAGGATRGPRRANSVKACRRRRRTSAEVAAGRPGRATSTTSMPAGKRSRSQRQASRNRRLARCRRTLSPIRREATRPTLRAARPAGTGVTQRAWATKRPASQRRPSALTASNSRGFRRRWARGKGPERTGLSGKALAANAAPVIDVRATTAGGHADAETAAASALEARGAISGHHGRTSWKGGKR